MRNRMPFLLCVIGGLLLISVNYTHGANTIVLLYLFLHAFPVLAPFFPIIDAVLFVLWVIALFGGFAVILGGYLLTASRVRVGKIIIAVAAGFGLISLILTILWVQAAFGLAGLLVFTYIVLNTAWTLGLVLTIIARSIAD